MTNLFEMQQAIVTTLTQKLPAGVPQEVREYRGQFMSLKELQKIATRKSAVLVAYHSFRDAESETGQRCHSVRWVIYAVASNIGSQKKYEVAAAIINNLMTVLPSQDWGIAMENPQKITGRNVTSGPIDQAGLEVWAITFEQKMAVDTAITMNVLDDFLTAHGDKDMGEGVPSASDEINLPQA